MAEGTGLENRQPPKGLGGSNPSPSVFFSSSYAMTAYTLIELLNTELQISANLPSEMKTALPAPTQGECRAFTPKSQPWTGRVARYPRLAAV